MRKNNGITLISLVITIAVLIILASIATYSGVNVIRQSKLNKFTSEMNIMQTEVNSLYDKYSTGTEEEQNTILNYGEVLDSNASKVFTTSTSGITDSSGYRYYTQATLKELGIDGIEGEFYVNVPKRSVISCEGLEYEGITYYTPEQLPNGVYNVEYEKVQLDEDGYFLKTSTINGEPPNENNPTIPEGFKPVDTATSKWPRILTTKPTQENLNNGLVIEDKSGNQFVWIPVSDINDMAQCSTAGGNCNLELKGNELKCKTHNSTEIVGKLYATTTDESFGTANTTYNPNSSLREPAVVTNSSSGTGTLYDGNSTYLSQLGYSTTSDFLTALKNQYKEMTTSVAKYKGFYVGRYELGLEGDTPVSKNASDNSSTVTTASANNSKTNMWYGLYKKCSEYTVPQTNNSSVTSSMIWGSQYDAMMNWMQDNGIDVKAKDDGTNTIRNSDSSKRTGAQSKDFLNNIYDLFGCHYEWTLEAYSKRYRVLRGGYSGYSYSPSYRYSRYPVYADGTYSSRLTLYIK